jgi:hypothetical protein
MNATPARVTPPSIAQSTTATGAHSASAATL